MCKTRWILTATATWIAFSLSALLPPQVSAKTVAEARKEILGGYRVINGYPQWGRDPVDPYRYNNSSPKPVLYTTTQQYNGVRMRGGRNKYIVNLPAGEIMTIRQDNGEWILWYDPRCGNDIEDRIVVPYAPPEPEIVYRERVEYRTIEKKSGGMQQQVVVVGPDGRMYYPQGQSGQQMGADGRMQQNPGQQQLGNGSGMQQQPGSQQMGDGSGMQQQMVVYMMPPPTPVYYQPPPPPPPPQEEELACLGTGTLASGLGTGGIAYGLASRHPWVAVAGAVLSAIGIFDKKSDPRCKAVAAMAGGAFGQYYGNTHYQREQYQHRQRPHPHGPPNPPPAPPPPPSPAPPPGNGPPPPPPAPAPGGGTYTQGPLPPAPAPPPYGSGGQSVPINQSPAGWYPRGGGSCGGYQCGSTGAYVGNPPTGNYGGGTYSSGYAAPQPTQAPQPAGPQWIGVQPTPAPQPVQSYGGGYGYTPTAPPPAPAPYSF